MDLKSIFNPMQICFDNHKVISTAVIPLCFHFLQKNKLQRNPCLGPTQFIIPNRPPLLRMSNKWDGYSSNWSHHEAILLSLYFSSKYQELSSNVKEEIRIQTPNIYFLSYPGKKREMLKSLLTHEMLPGKKKISSGKRFSSIACIIDVWLHDKSLNSLD